MAADWQKGTNLIGCSLSRVPSQLTCNSAECKSASAFWHEKQRVIAYSVEPSVGRSILRGENRRTRGLVTCRCQRYSELLRLHRFPFNTRYTLIVCTYGRVKRRYQLGTLQQHQHQRQQACETSNGHVFQLADHSLDGWPQEGQPVKVKL